MTSSTLGKITSEVEISNISSHGLWLFINEKEYFLSYNQYPWFKNATLNNIFDVKLLHGHHLHWPQLDVDLELKSINNPENYPLIYQSEPSGGH